MNQSGFPSRHSAGTVEAFVNRSVNGFYAHELADDLHAEVQESLRHLVQQHRLSRIDVDGQFLYTSAIFAESRKQLLARQALAPLL